MILHYLILIGTKPKITVQQNIGMNIYMSDTLQELGLAIGEGDIEKAKNIARSIKANENQTIITLITQSMQKIGEQEINGTITYFE